MGLAVSTLTRIIDVLVRKEVITRRSSAQDRRKVCVELTEKGKDLAEKLNRCGEQFWQKIFSEIPEKKKAEIAENLKLLVSSLEKAEQTCCQKN